MGPPPARLTCPSCKVKDAAQRHCDSKGCRYAYCADCRIFVLLRTKVINGLLGNRIQWFAVKWWKEKVSDDT